MNKTELIDFISEKADLTKANAQRAFDAMHEAITMSLQKGDPVVIANFGTYTVKRRAERKGRNPSTGEEITIKASNNVGFKAGKALKEAIKDKA